MLCYFNVLTRDRVISTGQPVECSGMSDVLYAVAQLGWMIATRHGASRDTIVVSRPDGSTLVSTDIRSAAKMAQILPSSADDGSGDGTLH